MRMPNEIADLLFKHLRGELTTEEAIELNNWKAESSENALLYEKLTDPDQIREMMNDLYSYKERAWDKILSKAPELRPDPIVRKFRWKSLSIAAAVLILLGTAVFIDLLIKKPKSPLPDKLLKAGTVAKDIPPGSDKAILTLASGAKVMLGKTTTDTNLQLSGNNISRLDSSSLHYSPSNRAGEETREYNTLATPRGGQFHLVLSDGTNVWLNAASSIRYPVAFAANERKVEIQGEVYFEVIKNTNAPFSVKARNTEIRVLGTHFNINSYDDENLTAVTLLEGSVKVVENNEGKIIKPGEQARLSNLGNSGNIEILNHVDTDQVIAWKNGRIFFKEADVPEIMRMISRWYDVDVVYKGDIPQKSITGAISRNANLSELLKVLELNNIHFSVDGKKITVTP